MQLATLVSDCHIEQSKQLVFRPAEAFDPQKVLQVHILKRPTATINLIGRLNWSNTPFVQDVIRKRPKNVSDILVDSTQQISETCAD